jgi:hypothetical protein
VEEQQEITRFSERGIGPAIARRIPQGAMKIKQFEEIKPQGRAFT